MDHREGIHVASIKVQLIVRSLEISKTCMNNNTMTANVVFGVNLHNYQMYQFFVEVVLNVNGADCTL